MSKNIMYKVNSGWIRWRGIKHRVNAQFIATNPSPAEQVMLDNQCTPVKVATAAVQSRPIVIQEEKADLKVVEPEVDTPGTGKKKPQKKKDED